METRLEMETELAAQLQSAANSNQFPTSRLTTLIQQAYKIATTTFIWNALVRGKNSSTKTNHEYYDYPSELRTNTIIRLTVGGVPYKKKDFFDYQDYKYNNSGTNFKMYADFGRQFFINPTPTSNGSGDLDVWGAIDADELDSASSTTIFSDDKQAANMAIVRLALSIAVKRIDFKLSQQEELAAMTALASFNIPEQKARQSSQRLEHPVFNVPDFYAGNNTSSPIGTFNYNPSIE